MNNLTTMKKSILRIALKWLFIISPTITGFAQTLNWDVNLAKPFTFTSLNPDDDPDVTVDQIKNKF